MLLSIHKYLQAAQFALAALLGLSIGYLVAVLLGASLRPSLSPLAERAPERPAEVRKPALEEYEVILERNIFNSADRQRATLTEVAVEQEPVRETRAPRQSLQLMGTVVAGADSLALIQAGGELKIYRLEQEVPGRGEVASIDRYTVEIRYADGSTDLLTLYEGAAGGAVSRPPSAGANSPSAAEPTGPGIRAVGENRFEIDQSMVATARENMGELLKQARLEPRLVNGRTEGFLVAMVRRNSLFERLGIQLGDVIMEVNGIVLDSPEKGLQVFQQLREAKNISLGLIRGNEPLTLQFQVN